jgi:hypothetical protein
LLTLWIVTGIGVAVLARRLTMDRVQASLVCALLAFLTWRVARILPLYVEAAAVLVAPALASWWPSKERFARPFAADERIVAMGIAVGAVVGFAMLTPARLSCLNVPDRWGPPSIEARRALDTAPPGRIVTFFNWGEYALWHLGPRFRVSMDGRRETVYSERRLAEHAAILSGDASGLAALASWSAEYVWLPSSSAATHAWLKAHGYRIDLEDEWMFVAARNDLPVLAAVGSEGVRRCFPD